MLGGLTLGFAMHLVIIVVVVISGHSVLPTETRKEDKLNKTYHITGASGYRQPLQQKAL